MFFILPYHIYFLVSVPFHSFYVFATFFLSDFSLYLVISQHAILGHTPYLSGLFGCVCLCRHILDEMLSHILIFRGFITSLLDGIHVILGHDPYPP